MGILAGFRLPSMDRHRSCRISALPVARECEAAPPRSLAQLSISRVDGRSVHDSVRTLGRPSIKLRSLTEDELPWSPISRLVTHLPNRQGPDWGSATRDQDTPFPACSGHKAPACTWCIGFCLSPISRARTKPLGGGRYVYSVTQPSRTSGRSCSELPLFVSWQECQETESGWLASQLWLSKQYKSTQKAFKLHSLTASAAGTRGFLLASLSEMTRFSITATPRHFR